MSKKIFVLDTNVLLHDCHCIYNFGTNDIVLPIVVLEELDNFKTRTDSLSFQSREFARELDNICGNGVPQDGIQIREDLGKLYIVTGKTPSPNMKESFPDKTPDHRILAICEHVVRENKDNDKHVILVSKDINLRLKARSLNIDAEDYETGKVQNLDELNSKAPVFENVYAEAFTKIYSGKGSMVKVDETGLEGLEDLATNQYALLKGGNKSTALTRYQKHNDSFKLVQKQTSYGITPRNAEQTFTFDALLNKNIQLVALSGKAGTGKTLLALAAALGQHLEYDQIMLARPVVSISSKEEIGFLPGDMKDKIGPYMQSYMDNIGFIKSCVGTPEKNVIEKLLKDEKLQMQALTYIRGRSLHNTFFIIDEAQNLTPHEVKTIVTRMGENSKVIFMGDIQQIDAPYLDSYSNGLSYLIDRMKGEELFAHVHLVNGERSALAELAANKL